MFETITTLVGTSALCYMGYNSFKANKDLKKQIQEERKQHKKTMVDVQKAYQNETFNLTNEYQIKLNSIQTEYLYQKAEFEKEIKWLHENFRNRGEILANNTLNDIKDELIRKGKVGANQIGIIPNVIIPDRKGVRSRQLDHLLLLPTGLYIIETKHWQGHTVLGFNKKTAGKFGFIDELLGNFSKENLVFTFEKKKLQVAAHYSNPITQVKIASSRLKDYLDDRKINAGWITGVVYFNHEEGKLHDWDKDTTVPRIKGPEDLREFVFNELDKKKWRLSYNTIGEIIKEISADNYLQETVQ